MHIMRIARRTNNIRFSKTQCHTLNLFRAFTSIYFYTTYHSFYVYSFYYLQIIYENMYCTWRNVVHTSNWNFASNQAQTLRFVGNQYNWWYSMWFHTERLNARIHISNNIMWVYCTTSNIAGVCLQILSHLICSRITQAYSYSISYARDIGQRVRWKNEVDHNLATRGFPITIDRVSSIDSTGQ